jgi:phage terminase large subunit-like protein
MPPICNYELDGVVCEQSGDHYCIPRAQHAVSFIEEICVHTKGRYARKPFILAPWQREDIVEPLFGHVKWNDEHGSYSRRYEIAWIEIARKNGKTELLAALMLYLLVGDGEQSAELFGIARDKEQASLCFDVAAQMVRLSPVLAKRLKITPHIKRIFDEKTHSFYQVIASDGAGALGSNPSGVAADEILAWRDGSMWEAMRTGMGSGARKQPMLIAATTAGNDSEGFAGTQHAEMQRIADDPKRTPHIFVYMRNTPREADPWDEKNWTFANPALDDFLSREGMRRQAMEAKNDPTQENGFRQFKLNQWVSQTHRWMPMHIYDANVSDRLGDYGVWTTPQAGRDAMTGRDAWLGFDLAARQDLSAWCLAFPDEDDGLDLLWRFWMPEAAVRNLDAKTGGQMSRWAAAGWLTVTDGDVLDFQTVYADIEADAAAFNILGGDCDQWSSDPVIQEISRRTDIEEIYSYKNDYTHMSPGMRTIMDLVKQEKFRHHGNPVARWCFDAVEARTAPYDPDIIRPDKPNRQTQSKRIDAVPAAIMAVKAWYERGHEDHSSIYDTEEVLILG